VTDREGMQMQILYVHGKGVTEEKLKEKGTIHTEFDEDLSWHYLAIVDMRELLPIAIEYV